MKTFKKIICSTWNISISLFQLVLIGVFLGCEKKDPNPELKDMIYQDMISQRAEAEKIIKDTEAKIIEILKSTANAAPQTGMKQKADRQIHELNKLKSRLAQQSMYWKIRIYERMKFVRLKSNKEKTAYKSDEKEWEKYQSEKKLRLAKNSWDLKARFKETGVEYDPNIMGEAAPRSTTTIPPDTKGH